MAEQSMGPRDFFRKEAAIADLALLACRVQRSFATW